MNLIFLNEDNNIGKCLLFGVHSCYIGHITQVTAAVTGSLCLLFLVGHPYSNMLYYNSEILFILILSDISIQMLHDQGNGRYC
jgi:hypothetical protein